MKSISKINKNGLKKGKSSNSIFTIYQLNADGKQETTYYYNANTSLEAMHKHAYCLSLRNGKVKKDDIYITANGYGLDVGTTTYWIKK